MKTQLNNVAAILAAGLLAGVSNGAMADAIETQHNAYDLVPHLSSAPTGFAGQARPAGPSGTLGRVARVVDDTPGFLGKCLTTMTPDERFG